jgi:hypothetical protein
VGKLTKEDFEDGEILDAEELASSGSTTFLSDIVIVSTTGSSKNVRASGYYLLQDHDDRIECGDVFTLVGSSGADGTYFVSAVLDNDNFTVSNDTISDSVGGTGSFRHLPGAQRVGVNPATIPNVSSSNVQDALEELGALSGSGGSGISETVHETLRQLVHFVEQGPGHGFGDYTKETDHQGAFETESRWYDGSVLLLKKTTGITGSGTPVKPTPIEYRMYDTDGTTVLQKIVEVVTYNGVFEVDRSGTIS